ncbi:MAG: hypothetical protein V7K94_19570 [Nostoc sp.]|uniref:hypothetical protein n=1 Tax=Nostoc sp. TaxID=1180 RepID=UPI002FF706DD
MVRRLPTVHYAIALSEKFLSLSVKQLVVDLSNADLESIADIPTPYLDCNEFSATPGRKIWRL